MAVGGLFDNVKKDEQNKKTKEIRMNNVFEIKVTTVTPLLQMNTEGNQRVSYVYDEDENQRAVAYKEPFWSANGLRGLFRRVALRDMSMAIKEKEKNFKIQNEEFYLYSSGSASDKKSIHDVDFKSESYVREHAPILSLFGAGLSNIAGKVAVDDLRISKTQKRYTLVEGKDGKPNYAVSNFIESNVFVRDDSASKQGILAEIVDAEDTQQWLEDQRKAVANSKSAKKEGNSSKEETSNMQQLVTIESIKPYAVMTTAINPINYSCFTDVELGCLVKTLVNTSGLQIGSAKRLGYGRLNWDVSLNGRKLFTSVRDTEYTPNRELVVTDFAKELIAKYDSFLDTLTSENIKITTMLKEFASSK